MFCSLVLETRALGICLATANTHVGGFARLGEVLAMPWRAVACRAIGHGKSVLFVVAARAFFVPRTFGIELKAGWVDRVARAATCALGVLVVVHLGVKVRAAFALKKCIRFCLRKAAWWSTAFALMTNTAERRSTLVERRILFLGSRARA